jgi:DnaJ-class molecular chaperone
MDAQHDAVCEGCGGEGYQSEDRADGRGEHYTVEVDCTECGGSGQVERDDDTVEPAEGGEVAWEVSL